MKPKFSSMTRFIIISLTSLLLISCERYEEDPLIVFGDAKDRIEGKRKLTVFTIDGRDTLSLFTNKWGSFYFDFTDSYDSNYNRIVRVRDMETNDEIEDGRWSVTGSYFSFYFNNFYGGGGKIIKCTRSQVKIQSSLMFFNLEKINSDSTKHYMYFDLEKL
jgi:hypothetical protein